jgi:hypothetical protein
MHTTCFNINVLYLFYTECVYETHMTHKVNSDYIPKYSFNWLDSVMETPLLYTRYEPDLNIVKLNFKFQSLEQCKLQTSHHIELLHTKF